MVDVLRIDVVWRQKMVDASLSIAIQVQSRSVSLNQKHGGEGQQGNRFAGILPPGRLVKLVYAVGRA